MYVHVILSAITQVNQGMWVSLLNFVHVIDFTGAYVVYKFRLDFFINQQFNLI